MTTNPDDREDGDGSDGEGDLPRGFFGVATVTTTANPEERRRVLARLREDGDEAGA